MATAGLLVHLWKAWGIQILVLVSFMLQVFLLIFAGIRRRNASTAARILLWLAYLLADNVSVYALGHMSLNSRPQEDRLVAFWAPFFLLHLGGQDNITAYSLEDNQLWKRHLLTLLVQVSGVAYVLCLYVASAGRTLIPASFVMFVLGVIKYGERVWALKCADIENLGSSLDIPAGEYSKLDRRGNLGEEEEVLLGAHYLFSLCRNEFVDRKPTVAAYKAAAAIKQGRQFELKGAMYMYELSEVELSLMYDFLYTKAPVIHTWYGCCIRLISPLGLLITFLLFQLSGIKDAYSRIDVAITYLLLIGAIILEMTSLFRALGSTWVCASLHARRWDQLHALVLCVRRLVRAGGNRRWLHSIGQHNLLDFCTRDKTKLKDRITKAIGLGDWWSRSHYSSTISISVEFKELVINQIVKMMRDWSRWNIRYVRGRAILTDCGMFDDIGWSVDGKDLDECILVWHIATDIYLSCYKDDQEMFKPEMAPLVKAIKVLSNYMGYLLLVRPYLMPGGVRRSLYRDNCPYLEEFSSIISTREDKSNHSKGEKDMSSHSRDEKGSSHGHSTGDVDSVRISTGEQDMQLSTGEVNRQQSIEEVEDRNTISTGQDGDKNMVSTREVKDKIEISIEEDGSSYPLLTQSEKLAKYLLQRFSDESFQTAYYRGPHLAGKLIGNQWDVPNILEVIFGVWVEFLCYTAHNCTEVPHCRQLGRGGDFLTVVRLVIYHIELFGINR
uniref:DUF4220 domain-containing protein n=1 Tax=Oryza brachyantha TaxID=4533 RepID=J3LVH1_ORYBR|nr:hypothetical protein [Oryza brachyantha]